jgi:hypothetical protein
MNITKTHKAHFQDTDNTNLEIVHEFISGHFYPNYSQWIVQNVKIILYLGHFGGSVFRIRAGT